MHEHDATQRPLSEAASSTRPLSRAFALLAAGTYGLIVLGALVRAHGAGLACPDWPLCFGQVVPEFDLKVAFEWGHRAVAGSVSIVFVLLSWRAMRDPRTRSLRGLIWITAAVLGVQILLGALTVWQLLASWTVTSHLLAGNSFAICLALISRRLYEIAEPREASTPCGATLRRIVSATALLLGGQIVLGGLVSSTYAGLACPDWPTCAEGVWFPSFEGARGLHLFHRLAAYALLAALGISAWTARNESRLRRLTQVGLLLGLLQVAVGVANVLLRIPVEVTGLHSGLAAALCLTMAFTVREAWRGAAQEQSPGAMLHPTPMPGK